MESARQASKAALSHAHEIEVWLRAGKSAACCLHDVRGMPDKFLQVAISAEQEHAAVPVVATFLRGARRPLWIRLLDEAIDGKDAIAAGRPPA